MGRQPSLLVLETFPNIKVSHIYSISFILNLSLHCPNRLNYFFIPRFVVAVELRTIWWLEIQGKINSGMLSPKTTYECYVIVKFVDRAYGLDFLPSKVTVEIGNAKSEGNVYLRQYESKKQCLETLWYSNRMELVLRSMAFRGIMEERVACKREDGWIEIELGSFYNNGGDNLEVKMSLKEVTGTHLKGGLVVEGIELRPKQQTTANHM